MKIFTSTLIVLLSSLLLGLFGVGCASLPRVYSVDATTKGGRPMVQTIWKVQVINNSSTVVTVKTDTGAVVVKDFGPHSTQTFSFNPNWVNDNVLTLTVIPQDSRLKIVSRQFYFYIYSDGYGMPSPFQQGSMQVLEITDNLFR
jgi:hypothetical protein